MTERALSFGTVAAAYERFRPGYPEELADAVLAYAGGPVRTALEIGAGTGKATRVFAGRGIAVTATEPDAAMLAELRAHVPPTVVTVRAAFEDVPLTSTYDLVFAAASLHWTRAAGRWPRVAALLRPGGVFAAFGGRLSLADPAVEEAVRTARGAALPDDGIPPPDGTPADSPLKWPGTELVRGDLFTDVRQSEIERRVILSARDYVGHLSTVSAYLELPAATREQVFARILDVLPPAVTLAADITVHLARKRRTTARPGNGHTERAQHKSTPDGGSPYSLLFQNSQGGRRLHFGSVEKNVGSTRPSRRGKPLFSIIPEFAG